MLVAISILFSIYIMTWSKKILKGTEETYIQNSDCVPISFLASDNFLSLSLLISKMGIQNICLYRISVKIQ